MNDNQEQRSQVSLEAEGNDPGRWRDNRKKRLKVQLLALAAIGLTRLLGWTYRCESDSMFTPKLKQVYEKHGSAIFAAWHGDHFPMLWHYKGSGVHVIISQSQDGEILHRQAIHLGYQTLRGSSTRGGQQALRKTARLVQAGAFACIAIDGPKGPRREVKHGIITLSQVTGRPIIPIGSASSSYWQFKSWDKFRLPKPFARTVTVLGEPYFPGKNESRDLAAAELKKRMDATQAEAEERCGCSG